MVFETVAKLTGDGEIAVNKYRSTATGLTAVVAQVEGPLVNGYLCFATEAHDDGNETLVALSAPKVSKKVFPSRKQTGCPTLWSTWCSWAASATRSRVYSTCWPTAASPRAPMPGQTPSELSLTCSLVSWPSFTR